MVQYEIDDGSPILIQYGSDEKAGVFLTVIDRRIQYKDEQTEEAFRVVERFSDGGGYYFRLITGEDGIREKVLRSTMADFMGRYGVPKMRIDELLGFYNQCMEYKKAAKLRCSECKWKFYCSKECQLAKSERHKHFCGIKIPEKRIKVTSSQKSVYGVLLIPEKEAKPKLVEVTLNLKVEDDYPFWKPKVNVHIQGSKAQYCPQEWGGSVEGQHTLQYYYSDRNYWPNECVRKIIGGKAPHSWVGPILVLKVQKEIEYGCQNTNYMDMKLEDCEDMIDFFSLYDVTNDEGSP